MEILRRHFGKVDATYFHLLGLLGLLALPARERPGFKTLMARLDAADRVLLKTPARRWAWMVGLRLADPTS